MISPFLRKAETNLQVRPGLAGSGTAGSGRWRQKAAVCRLRPPGRSRPIADIPGQANC